MASTTEMNGEISISIGEKENISENVPRQEVQQKAVDNSKTSTTDGTFITANRSIDSSFGSMRNEKTFEASKKFLNLTDRSGLTLSVARVRANLKKGKHAKIIRKEAAVYLAASLQFLIEEVLTLAGETALYRKRKNITPRHLNLSFRHDDELRELINKVTIAEGGVMEHIEDVLLPKGTKKPTKKKLSVESEIFD